MNHAVTPIIPANKGCKLPPEPLTQDEVKSLLRTCSQRAVSGVRNRALIVVLYRAGLRISEALALMQKDLDAKAGTVRVLHGKGDKSRVVGLDAGAWAIVQLWLDRRAAAGISSRAPVFCTLQGKSMKTAYVRKLLPRLARKAGIERRVHAHGLRHTHAYELACEGTPIHIIQSQLGHSNTATTARYISHLNPSMVIETMKSRTWSL
jgi:site-specific recombinase XerD